MNMDHLDQPLSDAWLRGAGFKWHEMERQGAKHWLLWVGDVIRRDGSMVDTQDLGIEVAANAYDGPDRPPCWHCWIRSDTSHRYSRFIHLRHLRTVRDLLSVIFGITGQEFDPEHCRYGSMLTPEHAARARAEDDRIASRLDQQILRDGAAWRKTELDDARGRPLAEHLQKAIDLGGAK